MLRPFALMQAIRDNDITEIVHTAANPMLTTGAQRDPYAAIQLNIMGTVNVLEAARVMKLGRVVVSSSNVLSHYLAGGEGKGDLGKEEALPRPVTFYATTKQTIENLGLNYARWCGVDFAAVRYGAVAGPWSGRGGGGPSNVFRDAVLKALARRGGGGARGRDGMGLCQGRGAGHGAGAQGRRRSPTRVFNITMGSVTAARGFAAALQDGGAGRHGPHRRPAGRGRSLMDMQHTRRPGAAPATCWAIAPRFGIEAAVRDMVAWYRANDARPPGARTFSAACLPVASAGMRRPIIRARHAIGRPCCKRSAPRPRRSSSRSCSACSSSRSASGASATFSARAAPTPRSPRSAAATSPPSRSTRQVQARSSSCAALLGSSIDARAGQAARHRRPGAAAHHQRATSSISRSTGWASRSATRRCATRSSPIPPSSNQAGQFDRNVYAQVLAANHMTEPQFEAMQRDDPAEAQLTERARPPASRRPRSWSTRSTAPRAERRIADIVTLPPTAAAGLAAAERRADRRVLSTRIRTRSRRPSGAASRWRRCRSTMSPPAITVPDDKLEAGYRPAPGRVPHPRAAPYSADAAARRSDGQERAGAARCRQGFRRRRQGRRQDGRSGFARSRLGEARRPAAGARRHRLRAPKDDSQRRRSRAPSAGTSCASTDIKPAQTQSPSIR